MRLRMKEQFICCVFAIILFVMGMCVEIPQADSFFLRSQEASDVNTSGSVIRSGANIRRVENVSVIETLRRDVSTYLNSSNKRIQSGKFVRIAIIVLAVEMLLAHLFYFGETAEFACRKRISSHAAIVRYIQQEDGKK